eukprot:1600731-Prymnesium_polylepis.1
MHRRSLFSQEAMASLREYTGVGGKNLWGSPHPFAAVLREADTVHGIFTLRGKSSRERDEEEDDDDEADDQLRGLPDSFEVVVCSQLPAADALGMLAESLPLERMRSIVPHPSTVQLKYSHYKSEFELEVGGTLSWAALDDKYSL